MTRHIRVPVVGRALAPIGSEFVSIEALGGTVLPGGDRWPGSRGRTSPARRTTTLWAHDLTIGGVVRRCRSTCGTGSTTA